MLMQVVLPSSDLQGWIHSFRSYCFQPDDDPGMILYPGTGAELWVVQSGNLSLRGVSRADGLLCLRHYSLGFRQKQAVIFSVRFRAGALPFFLRSAIASVTDLFSPVDAVWGEAGGDVARHIRQSGDFGESCQCMADFLLAQCVAGKVLEPMQLLASTIYNDCAGFSLNRFCDCHDRHRSGISHRFHETQGVSIKYYHRLCRFERFIRDALYTPEPKLADLSVKLGYYDQAHMNRELRLLTQKTPLTLLRQKTARLFYEPRSQVM